MVTLSLLGMALSSACATLAPNPTDMPDLSGPITSLEQWPASRPFRFLVVGDTQRAALGRPTNDPPRHAIYDRLLVALADSSAAFVVHVGDLVENGSNGSHWRDHFDAPFWDRLAPIHRARFLPIPGNHEYKTTVPYYGGGDLHRYFDRFPHLEGRRYYHFFHAGAGFIYLDSGRNGVAKRLFGERWQNGLEEQIDWLRHVVFPQIRRRSAEGQLDRLFVFYHKPAYPTPITLRNRQSGEVLELFDDLNRDLGYRLEVVAFSGHIHTFSHIVRDYNGDGQGPVDQFVTGGGGGPQRGWKYYRKIQRPEDLDQYRRRKYTELAAGSSLDESAFTRVRQDSTHFGYLEIAVDERLQVIYHRYDPQTDSFFDDYTFTR
ncbi:metallophosphoesterase family protein [Candidatus Latescibacterota bacterium]